MGISVRFEMRFRSVKNAIFIVYFILLTLETVFLIVWGGGGGAGGEEAEGEGEDRLYWRYLSIYSFI